MTTLLLLVGGACADATVIFNNFGAGDSFSSMGFGIGVPNFSNNRGARFSVGPSDFVFTSAQAALQYFSGTNTVTFGLRSDASGLPGTLLESFTVSNIPTVSPGGVVTFNATAPLVLMAGDTYWLTSEEYAPDDTGLGWRTNDTGINTANALRIGMAGWSVTAQDTPAFRINGNPTPEPATLSLLCLGSLMCLFDRRLRKRIRSSIQR